MLHAAHAAAVQDDFTGASATVGWSAYGGACLTAGDGTGSIPACVGDSYYGPNFAFTGGSGPTLPDSPGNGALRLTNGGKSTNQTGAILSPTPFPSNQGLQVTFSTVTYGGNNLNGTGADGMSFFLLDGSRKFNNIGSYGGTLGYGCTHSAATTDGTSADGIVGGYLGLGIDEFGNFLANTNSINGEVQATPGRIGLRGAGTVAWNWLNANYPQYYPTSLNAANRTTAVELTCASGQIENFSGIGRFLPGIPVAAYPEVLGGSIVLPSGEPLADESAGVRQQATPISYKINLTQDGYLSFAYSYNGGVFTPVLSNQLLAGLSAANAAVPSSFTFGFAGSIGNGSNVHEILCFKATSNAPISTSAISNIAPTGQVQTDSQIYLAFAHSDNSWGQLTSQNLVLDPSTNILSVSSAINWDGNCTLTGGACATTGVATTALAPASRSILTWNPATASGTGLEWSGLSTSQQAALSAGDKHGADRLAFLRGDRTNELSTADDFRARTGVLGDITDSSPTWSGPPAASYADQWKDQLQPSQQSSSVPEDSGQTYSAYVKAGAKRLNVVFAGANDGLLHGFEAGSYDGSGIGVGNFGNFVSTNNDGREVLAYAPNATLQTIHNSSVTALDFSSPSYAHNYDVDATPALGDLYYNSAWHTWLAGGLGAGGSAVYALDVTDPSKFSESNASSLVVGEWSAANISCVNLLLCANYLGKTFGTPVIRRLHNGSWAIIFGSGIGAPVPLAGIYIMTIGPTGAVSATYFLSTNSGGKSTPDGITSVTAVDFDNDHITDYVYAGDLLGNVWKFDLTSATPSNWKLSGAVYAPGKAAQPISTAVQVISVPNPNGAPRVLVEFGTGQETAATTTSGAMFATGTQAIYGVWDAQFSDWNAKSSVQFASLANAVAVTPSQLEQQTVTATGKTTASLGVRTISSNPICWTGSAPGCNQMGFFLNLPATGEQIVYSPLESNGVLLVNSLVPADNSPGSCNAGAPTGWTMALDASTGGALSTSYFTNGANTPLTLSGSPVSGAQLNASGTGSVLQTAQGTYLLNQTLAGSAILSQVNPSTGSTGSRITWIQSR